MAVRAVSAVRHHPSSVIVVRRRRPASSVYPGVYRGIQGIPGCTARRPAVPGPLRAPYGALLGVDDSSRKTAEKDTFPEKERKRHFLDFSEIQAAVRALTGPYFLKTGY